MINWQQQPLEMDESVDNTIAKYETFINDVLKEDLRQLEARLQEVNSEISDLIQQKQTLKVITNKAIHPDGFKSQVNLGCNFFMEAAVKDTSSMLVNVGLNHYLELSLPETLNFLEIRTKACDLKATELRTKGAQTKAHIKLMLFGIGQLHNEKK